MALEGVQLINQICANSGLKGKALEELRNSLSALSEAELQARLIASLVGDNYDLDKGVRVEHSELDEIETESELEETLCTDEEGNEVKEYRNNGNLVERHRQITDKSVQNL